MVSIKNKVVDTQKHRFLDVSTFNEPYCKSHDLSRTSN